MDKLYNTNITVYEEDINMFKGLIVPKLEGKARPSIFVAITFLTPNYQDMYTLYNLSLLVKHGFRVVCMLSDYNVFNYKPSDKELARYGTTEEYLDAKLAELRVAARNFGIQEEDMIIKRSSLVWKRLVSLSKPPLFMDFYKGISGLKGEDIHNENNMGHVLQLPINLFVAHNFHILYPEEMPKPIDAFLSTERRIPLYTRLREIFYDARIFATKRPCCLSLKDTPKLIHDDEMPEWNMDYDEIKYLIVNINPKLEVIEVFFSAIFPQLMKDYTLKAGNSKRIVTKDQMMPELKNLAHDNLLDTFSFNLYKYLRLLRRDLPASTMAHVSSSLEISTLSDAKNIGKVLKNDIHLKILQLCDGTRNTTQIARLLDRQISNISKNISYLKQEGLVEQGKYGVLTKKINSLYLNFDSLK